MGLPQTRVSECVGHILLLYKILGIVVSILLAVATFFFSASIFDAAISGETSDIPVFGSIINEMVEELDEDGSDKCEVTVGEFVRVQRSGYETGMLELTVTNITDEPYSYDITVDAFDADGTRIGTEYVVVENLEPGQTAKAAAFENINSTQIESFENARFEITAISAFNEY